MFKAILAGLGIAMLASTAQADMTAKLLPPWDGKKVPSGQHCKLHGGNGSTPPIQLSGLPEGTVMIQVEYNDKSYAPLSSKGGHGIIGYPVNGSTVKLQAVPGMTAKLPGGVRVLKKARGIINYASAGYLPPCSGGRGNNYVADIKAVSAEGQVLAKTKLKLGRY